MINNSFTEKTFEEHLYWQTQDIESALNEADKEADSTDVRYTSNEVFDRLKKLLTTFYK